MWPNKSFPFHLVSTGLRCIVREPKTYCLILQPRTEHQTYCLMLQIEHQNLVIWDIDIRLLCRSRTTAQTQGLLKQLACRCRVCTFKCAFSNTSLLSVWGLLNINLTLPCKNRNPIKFWSSNVVWKNISRNGLPLQSKSLVKLEKLKSALKSHDSLGPTHFATGTKHRLGPT
jgi:hypothetical protein